jgi:hypothetical protein
MAAEPSQEVFTSLGQAVALTTFLERAIRQGIMTAMLDLDVTGRWLGPKALARYIGRDSKTLSALVQSGKLPKPTYHLGPKSPRYDRMAVDAMLVGQREHADVEDIANRAIQRMRQEYEGRPARARRRNRT